MSVFKKKAENVLSQFNTFLCSGPCWLILNLRYLYRKWKNKNIKKLKRNNFLHSSLSPWLNKQRGVTSGQQNASEWSLNSALQLGRAPQGDFHFSLCSALNSVRETNSSWEQRMHRASHFRSPAPWLLQAGDSGQITPHPYAERKTLSSLLHCLPLITPQRGRRGNQYCETLRLIEYLGAQVRIAARKQQQVF